MLTSFSFELLYLTLWLLFFFSRLGDKVKASPKGSMGHLVKQVLDAASSVEEGELSESSLER